MNEFMKAAIEEARKGINARHGGPFGAVIVKDGRIIARGHNTVIKNGDCTEHGEMNAIRNACKQLGTFDLSGCEMYTTGQPCPMCYSAIKWANIDKIYYGCNYEDTAKIGFKDNFIRDAIVEGIDKDCEEVDRDDCLELYKEWLDIPDKTMY